MSRPMIPAGRRVNDRRPGVASNGRHLPGYSAYEAPERRVEARCFEHVLHFESEAERAEFVAWLEDQFTDE
jgi:hypothetical protein